MTSAGLSATSLPSRVWSHELSGEAPSHATLDSIMRRRYRRSPPFQAPESSPLTPRLEILSSATRLCVFGLISSNHS